MVVISLLSKEELHGLYEKNNQSVDSLRKAETIGCFYCRKLVDFEAIHQCIHEGKHVRGGCPHCGIDALLPLDGYHEKQYAHILEAMHATYFEETSFLGDWLESI